MTRTLVLTNHKGGVGKSTSATNIAFGLGPRHVHFAGCTAYPNQAWVTQQTRQLTWYLQDQSPEREPLRLSDP